jgi:hypothetical protein
VYVKKDKKGFPDPGKYDPKDTTYSRHKSQMVCKFGSAKRFKYEVCNFSFIQLLIKLLVLGNIQKIYP